MEYSEMDYEDCEKILEDFFQATAKGNLARCQELCSDYTMTLGDMNMQRHSLSPLCCAAQSGQLHVLKWLLSNGAAINEPDGRGRTGLFCALSEDKKDVFQFLLDSGCDVNVQPLKDCSYTRTQSCLRYAIKQNDMHSIRMLVQHGCNVNESLGDSPLHQACKQGDADMVEALLDAGADPNVTVRGTGFTALHVAVSAKNHQVIELLAPITDKPALNSRGQTPVHHAALSDNARAIHVLAHHGWDLNSTCHMGSYPLFDAAMCGNVRTVKALVECGCDINQTYPYTRAYGDVHGRHGQHILHALAKKPVTGDKQLEVAKVLMSSGCELNTCCSVNSETPLHVACKHGALSLVKLLLTNGADYQLKDGEGRSAIACAQNEGNNEICRVFTKVEGHSQCDVKSSQRYHISDAASKPQKLVNLCRLVIRPTVSLPFRSNVHKLPLPLAMKQFVCMDEIHQV